MMLKAAQAKTAVTWGIVGLRAELQQNHMRVIANVQHGAYGLELCQGLDAVWLIVRRTEKGGLALRCAPCPGGVLALRKVRKSGKEAVRIEVRSVIGVWRISLNLLDRSVPVFRVTTSLETAEDLLTSFVSRDLYVLDEQDDPTGAVGCVEAAQRGMNTGAVFFRVTQPAFGSALYLQDLTSLNEYFALTDTKPDGAVGGIWPELGFLLPTPPQKGEPPVRPIPAGQETVISDVVLALHDDCDGDEQEMAHRYLTLLGTALRHIQRPPTEYRDWVDRANRSLRDLAASPKATIRHYGHRYVHPYTAAEYPDSMVQLSVLSSIRDYERWSGETCQIGKELAGGLGKFFDPKLQTLRRYLPNVGKDKDKFAVDSWYLYHPLMKLGRLALDGDAQCRRLFEKSVGFGIKAAQHFNYCWPIQYDVRDFTVLQEARDDKGLGQTDVGGIYAYVMLQAFELTDDKRYLDEARAAIDAAAGMRFELNYQANLTAWGAAACLRLWRITDEQTYLRQSYVYLASFFHNTAMWESEIGHARHYRNFLGVTALHDAPYMAMYECFDSFAAFERYLKDSGPELDPAVRLLLCEYCRYALDRAWFYYPDALPPEVVADEQRENNGHVDRALSFPVEDLYVDGQPAGQVGQEIYGCGSAFVFASRSFHVFEGAPFRLFCDHFLLSVDNPAERVVSFQLAGCAASEAFITVVWQNRRSRPKLVLAADDAEPLKPVARHPTRLDFSVPADGRITLSW